MTVKQRQKDEDGLWTRFRRWCIDKLGDTYEYSQFNGYWRAVEYTGPFKREYDGRFRYGASLEKILQDAEALTPLTRRNDIIGFKHRTSENKPDDPFYGTLPVMLVYACVEEKDRVIQILKSLGVTKADWLADPSFISPLEEAITSRDMLEQGKSSPYSVQ